MANEITFFTPAYKIAQGVSEVMGSIEVDSYVQHSTSPVAGEDITGIFNKFSRQSIIAIVFEGDGIHECTIDRDNKKLILTVQASGAQATAGTDATIRFIAKGKG